MMAWVVDTCLLMSYDSLRENRAADYALSGWDTQRARIEWRK